MSSSGNAISTPYSTVTRNDHPSTHLVASPAPESIFGSGEMVERTRAFDWSTTSVGAIEGWSETLLAIVNTLLASSHPLLFWWGDDLVQFYNDAYRATIGNDKHPRALGQTGMQCWPEFWSRIGPQIEQVMCGGPSIWKEDEPFLITRYGYLEETYWSYSYSAVRDRCGRIRGTLAATLENTHRKHAEAALRGEVKRLSELFEQAPAFFCVVRGPDYMFESVNPLYRQMMGDRPLIGRTVLEAIPEVASQGFLELLEGVYKTGEPWIGRNTPIKLKYPGSDKLEERVIDFVYQPLRDESGVVTGILAFGVDVTEAKRNEKALYHNEKLAAVGRLATTIAHEINNPLETVANLLHLIEGEIGSPKEALAHIALAQQEVRRIANISVNTLKFSRQTTRATPTELHAVLDSVQAMYVGRVRNSGVCLVSRYRSHQLLTSYAAELAQVFANFLSNALDATLPGGQIHMRVRPGSWVPAKYASEMAGIFVTFADTGSGMSRETLDRIYDPFFTTKEMTGTGLGLWLSKELVKKHHGQIRVRSRQTTITTDAGSPQASSGTVFQIFLPYENGL